MASPQRQALEDGSVAVRRIESVRGMAADRRSESARISDQAIPLQDAAGRRAGANGGLIRAASTRAPPIFHGDAVARRGSSPARSRDRSPLDRRSSIPDHIHMTREEMQRLETMIEHFYNGRHAEAERRWSMQYEHAIGVFRNELQCENATRWAQLQSEDWPGPLAENIAVAAPQPWGSGLHRGPGIK